MRLTIRNHDDNGWDCHIIAYLHEFGLRKMSFVKLFT